MKVKTSELSGVQLDYAVAYCVDLGQPTLHITRELAFMGLRGAHYSPSSIWGHCGPLIDEYKLHLIYMREGEWKAVLPNGCSALGELKIAICRAVVSAKLGHEVEIPDQLMEVK